LSQLLGDQGDAVVSRVALSAISANTRQPRLNFDEEALAELAQSIREFGVLQPLIIRPVGEGKYELIAGERRLRACHMVGLEEVPVVVRSASAQASLEIALIENVQREDISAIECALAYKKLADEFNMTQEQVAGRVGKSRVAVANALRLLKLPQEVQSAVLEGEISEGHARALLSLESPLRQVAALERIRREGLSVREVERLSKGQAEPAKAGKSGRKERPLPKADANWVSLEQGLSEYFGSPVRLQPEEVGGKMTISFYSDDDLQRILDILGINL
jgi:ParB family chromosome partitioning protein